MLEDVINASGKRGIMSDILLARRAEGNKEENHTNI